MGRVRVAVSTRYLRACQVLPTLDALVLFCYVQISLKYQLRQYVTLLSHM